MDWILTLLGIIAVGLFFTFVICLGYIMEATDPQPKNKAWWVSGLAGSLQNYLQQFDSASGLIIKVRDRNNYRNHWMVRHIFQGAWLVIQKGIYN